jgi:protein involved in polysaccharide export with SLBB domain
MEFTRYLMESPRPVMPISDASHSEGNKKFLKIQGFSRSKEGRNGFLQVALLSLLLIGCSSPTELSPPPMTSAQLEGDYRLSPNDLLDFRIYQEPDFDAVIRVSGDGSAIFPMVGRVHVAGMTITQATETLRQRYMTGYLANPQVNLTVRTYARQMFTILGQVQKPGTYPIEGSESISLLQAIGTAGGYTRIANPSKVVVKRNEGGIEKVYNFNAKKMARTAADSTFRIMPGDVITVAESIF